MYLYMYVYEYLHHVLLFIKAYVEVSEYQSISDHTSKLYCSENSVQHGKRLVILSHLYDGTTFMYVITAINR